MKTLAPHARWLSLCLCVCVAAANAHAGPLKDTLDCSEKNGKILDSYFSRYPQKPQTIFRQEERPGLRFWLTPENVHVGQSTLYSNFVIAGDFEISMTYDGFEVPKPTTGYGISCGLAVDTENRDGTPGIRVHLTRSSLVGKGDGYAVTVGMLKKKERGIDYKLTEFSKTSAKSGKLALKRVRDNLYCLVGESETPIDELYEIAKIKFTDSTIKKLRIFADQGGAPTLLDAYIDKVLIRAEEITFQIPQRDRPRWFWWIVAAIAFLIVGRVATVVHRRNSNKRA